MNTTVPDPIQIPAPETSKPAQTVSDLERRWPSVNLEEQRELYARIERLRANLLKSRPSKT